MPYPRNPTKTHSTDSNLTNSDLKRALCLHFCHCHRLSQSGLQDLVCEPRVVFRIGAVVMAEGLTLCFWRTKVILYVQLY